ncbi:MAG: DUF5011 domain-containing protein [Bacteroidota bacterium]
MKIPVYIVLFSLALASSCRKEDMNDPVITLKGNSTVYLFMGDTYQEQGAYAQDQEDGDISGRIEIEGAVNTAQAGIYYLTYTAADDAGNEGSAIRTVVISNHAYLLEGTYLVSDTVVSAIPANNDTLSYTLNVIASSLTDNRLFLQNLHNFGSPVSVFADVSGTSLSLPSQNPTGMIQPGTIVSISGICTSTAITRLNYTVDYSFNGAGIDDTCSAVLVKQ